MTSEANGEAISRASTPPLDFEQLREQWSKYEISDGAVLKVKIVLLKVFRKAQPVIGSTSATASSTYGVDLQTITVITTNERGQQDTKPRLPQEVAAHIVKDNLRFRTVEQDWNEYLTSNNIRILVQPMVMRVGKSSFFDGRGEPLYHVEIQGTVQIQPPKTSPPPTQ